MCPIDVSCQFLGTSLENILLYTQPDVSVTTSSGLRIPAHSHILAMASPVLEKKLEKAKRNGKTGDRVISMLGVPSEAVSSFLRFIYSFRCADENMDKYGMHLLVLSHVFSVPKLKQRCTKGLAIGLTIENVLDVLQLARLCDAPELHLKGMKLVSGKFRDVKKTEGWRFVQKHDPWLELDILQFIDDVASRKKRSKRQKKEQGLYQQLSEAMDCMVHICTEGCTSVGPYDMEPHKNKEPCNRFDTCHGLQMLIRHFATCDKRVNGGCFRCKRMWQLLKLHASMCEQSERCRVPLCRQFKLKMQLEKKGEDGKWRMLVKKVLQAKTISSLSLGTGLGALHPVRKFGTHSCDATHFQACNRAGA